MAEIKSVETTTYQCERCKAVGYVIEERTPGRDLSAESSVDKWRTASVPCFTLGTMGTIGPCVKIENKSLMLCPDCLRALAAAIEGWENIPPPAA